MHVDEAMAGSRRSSPRSTMRFDVLQLRGLYFNVDAMSRHGFPWPLDAPRDGAVLGQARARWASCCASSSARGRATTRQATWRHIAALGRMLARHRDLRLPPGDEPAGCLLRQQRPLRVPRRTLRRLPPRAACARGDVSDHLWRRLGLSLSRGAGADRSLRDQLGADRLVWGSDMPNVERFCTYKQSLDYVRRYCPFLTAREKDLILGDTCAAFYGIGRQRAAPSPGGR